MLYLPPFKDSLSSLFAVFLFSNIRNFSMSVYSWTGYL